MYKKYDEIISKCSVDDPETKNYWYEVGCNDAIEILNNFDKKDWQDLMNNLPSKSNEWKACMLYSLCNPNDVNQLDALLAVIETDDYDLFTMIINVLNARDFQVSNAIKIKLMEKIYKYLEDVPSYDRDLFIEYYNKIVEDLNPTNNIRNR